MTPDNYKLLQVFFDKYLETENLDSVLLNLRKTHCYLEKDFIELVHEHVKLIQNEVDPSSQVVRAPQRLLLKYPNLIDEPIEIYQRVHDFVILRLLGKGALADVYLAHDTHLDRMVALKFQRRESIYEAQTLAALDHPHIIRVFYEFSWKGYHVLCSQYIEGMNLGELFNSGSINSDSEVSVESLLSGFYQIVTALNHAHESHILHLDIKPENILVESKGHFYLTDFNVAIRKSHMMNSSVKGQLGGTPGYMAPEQEFAFDKKNKYSHSFEDIDHRADIYGLGQVLKDILSFISKGKVYLDIPLKDLVSELQKIQLKATEIDRANRFSTMLQFQKTISSLLWCFKVQKSIFRTDWLSLFIYKNPSLSLVLAALVPQILGSLINILYNSAEIIEQLNTLQRAKFVQILLVYNLVFVPLGICLFFYITRKLYFTKEVKRFSYAQKIPGALFAATSIGWIPGSLLFPWMLSSHTQQGELSFNMYFHFGISFFIAWAISLAFSQLLSSVIVLEAYLPKSSEVPQQIGKFEPFIQYLPTICSVLPVLSTLVVLWSRSIELSPQESIYYRGLLSLLLSLTIVSIIFSNSLKNRLQKDLRILSIRS